MLSRSTAVGDELDDGLRAVVGIRLEQEVRTFDPQQARFAHVRDVLVGEVSPHETIRGCL